MKKPLYFVKNCEYLICFIVVGICGTALLFAGAGCDFEIAPDQQSLIGVTGNSLQKRRNALRLLAPYHCALRGLMCFSARVVNQILKCFVLQSVPHRVDDIYLVFGHAFDCA